MGAFKNARREESTIRDQHNKSKSARIREAEERQLQALLRQHEEIGDRIIALVYKTSAETEQLVRAMQKKPGDLVAFPKSAGQTQKSAWGRNVLSRIMRKNEGS